MKALITSLDPAFSKVQSNIWACNHTIRFIKYQPDIAKSWTISPDAKTYYVAKGHLFSKAHFIW
jgi:peptide/nickel transport system substrate-binding protein